MREQRFGPYRVNLHTEQLWHGAEERGLRPKTFAVLRYFVEHPHRLVSKEELFEAIWPTLTVSEAALTVCVGELRKALGDDPQRPQFVETVHGRGYRFIGTLETLETPDAERAPPGGRSLASIGSADRPLDAPLPDAPDLLPLHAAFGRHRASWSPSPFTMVGREEALRRLQGWLEQAWRGERQVGFVTGEPGMGKTMLVDAFLVRAATQGGWVARGQCIEHYGPGEAYLPVLAALGQLCRAPEGTRFLALLSQHAPAWLLQMPTLCSAAALEMAQRMV